MVAGWWGLGCPRGMLGTGRRPAGSAAGGVSRVALSTAEKGFHRSSAAGGPRFAPQLKVVRQGGLPVVRQAAGESCRGTTAGDDFYRPASANGSRFAPQREVRREAAGSAGRELLRVRQRARRRFHRAESDQQAEFAPQSMTGPIDTPRVRRQRGRLPGRAPRSPWRAKRGSPLLARPVDMATRSGAGRASVPAGPQRQGVEVRPTTTRLADQGFPPVAQREADWECGPVRAG